MEKLPLELVNCVFSYLLRSKDALHFSLIKRVYYVHFKEYVLPKRIDKANHNRAYRRDILLAKDPLILLCDLTKTLPYVENWRFRVMKWKVPESAYVLSMLWANGDFATIQQFTKKHSHISEGSGILMLLRKCFNGTIPGKPKNTAIFRFSLDYVATLFHHYANIPGKIRMSMHTYFKILLEKAVFKIYTLEKGLFEDFLSVFNDFYRRYELWDEHFKYYALKGATRHSIQRMQACMEHILEPYRKFRAILMALPQIKYIKEPVHAREAVLLLLTFLPTWRHPKCLSRFYNEYHIHEFYKVWLCALCDSMHRKDDTVTTILMEGSHTDELSALKCCLERFRDLLRNIIIKTCESASKKDIDSYIFCVRMWKKQGFVVQKRAKEGNPSYHICRKALSNYNERRVLLHSRNNVSLTYLKN